MKKLKPKYMKPKHYSKLRWTVTTVSTVTPWSKTFETFEEMNHWRKSMDIEDGWALLAFSYYPRSGGQVGERWITWKGGAERTHILEVSRRD